MAEKIVEKKAESSKSNDSIPIIDYVQEVEVVVTPPTTPGGKPEYQRVVRRTLSFKDAVDEGLLKNARCPEVYIKKEGITCEAKGKRKGLLKITRGCNCLTCIIQYQDPPETFGEMVVSDFFKENPEANVVFLEIDSN